MHRHKLETPKVQSWKRCVLFVGWSSSDCSRRSVHGEQSSWQNQAISSKRLEASSSRSCTGLGHRFSNVWLEQWRGTLGGANPPLYTKWYLPSQCCHTRAQYCGQTSPSFFNCRLPYVNMTSYKVLEKPFMSNVAQSRNILLWMAAS